MGPELLSTRSAISAMTSTSGRGPFVAWWTPVTQPNKVKHRFLGCRLRFLVACQYGKNQGLLSKSVSMPGVERGAQVNLHIEP